MNIPKVVNKYALLFIGVFLASVARAENWPQWRGPTGMGISTEKNLPIHWSTNQNVRWKHALPGPGNSTPIVWNDRIFLTQSVESDKKQGIICLDRAGKLVWEKYIPFKDNGPTHETNPFASGSPVTDGEHVIAWFGSAGLYCYDFSGKEMWHRDLGKQNHIWGYGASPIIYKDLAILNFGPGDRSFLIAVNKKTGETVWEHKEPGSAPDKYAGSWGTPVVIKVNRRDEMVLGLPERVAAFDPNTGKELWFCKGLNPLVYTSILYSDGIVVAMGGFNGSSLAVKTGGNGDITESNRLWHIPKTKQRIGSGVISDGFIYILNDPGIAECFELKTGKLVWEERLKGPGAKADNWSSLVLAEGNLYAVNQSGDGFVFKASPKFELISTNPLGELVRGSVAISNGELFIRGYKNLWCIGRGKVTASN